MKGNKRRKKHEKERERERERKRDREGGNQKQRKHDLITATRREEGGGRDRRQQERKGDSEKMRVCFALGSQRPDGARRRKKQTGVSPGTRRVAPSHVESRIS